MLTWLDVLTLSAERPKGERGATANHYVAASPKKRAQELNTDTYPFG